MELKNTLPWIILAFLHLVFLAFALHGANTQLKDSSEYLQQAVNLRTAGSWYCGDLSSVVKPELFSQRPPLYGFVISLLSVTASSATLLFILQALLSFFNCRLAYITLEKLLLKKYNAFYFLLPLLFFPVQFVYANMIMSEMLFQTFILLSLYFGISYLKKNSMMSLWCFQVMITLSFLVKPFTVLLPVFFFFIAMIYCLKLKKNFTPLVTFLLPFAVIAGMINFNYSKTGVAEYSSISRKLIINYNVYALLENVKGAKTAFQEVDSVETEVSLLPYQERVKKIDNFCWQQIKQYPFRYSMLHLYGAWRFFTDPCDWETNHFFNIGSKTAVSSVTDKEVHYTFYNAPVFSKLYSFAQVLMNLFLVAAFVVITFLKKINSNVRLLMACFILYFALLTGPSASSRFRLPVFPVLLISCGLFINNVSDEVKAQSKSGV